MEVCLPESVCPVAVEVSHNFYWHTLGIIVTRQEWQLVSEPNSSGLVGKVLN